MKRSITLALALFTTALTGLGAAQFGGADPCECLFETGFQTTVNDPPPCAVGYGLDYTVEQTGRCSSSTCTAQPCRGTLEVFADGSCQWKVKADFGSGNETEVYESDGDLEEVIEHPTDEDGDGSFEMGCGETWSFQFYANGIALEAHRISCRNCSASGAGGAGGGGGGGGGAGGN